MKKNIVKIEVATQNAQGKTQTGATIFGPGKTWHNIVAWDLQEANIPSGSLVHLTLWHSDNTTTYQFFPW